MIKPAKIILPTDVALSTWRGDGSIYQEKLDGRFAFRAFGNSVLAGEDVGGLFTAFDCLTADGQDVRGLALTDRLCATNDICRAFGVPFVNSSADGGKFLADVLAAGGEGVVRKLPGSSYFDTMQAAKRVATWQCVVTALNYATGGARIKDLASGEDRGTVPLRNRSALCRVGSILKVEGLELTAKGLIREPRPCKDTAESWLIQF